MSKKRIISGMIAVAVVLGICFHVTGTVRAAGSETDAKAIITKELRMDENVTTPNAEFTFDIEKVSFGGQTGADAMAKMPDITSQTIRYTAADTGTTDSKTRIKTVRKQTGNGTDSFLPQCNTDTGFRQEGLYVYRITEKPNTGFTNDSNHTMTWSDSKYLMTVFVIKKEGSSELYIAYVIVQPVDQDGEAGAKIDNPGVDTEENPNDFIFTGSFTKMGGSDSGDDEPHMDDEPDLGNNRDSLKIFKVVTGNMGDKQRDFQFTLTLTKASALEGEDAAYTATIIKADGSKSTETFTVGTAKTFALKHNEYLYFSKLPVGTLFTVTEETVTGYTVAQATISNGTNLTPAAQGNVLVGEKSNVAGFYNDKNVDNPLTGILTDNLPFVLLIVTAVLGFAVYLTVRRRRFKS